MLCRPESATTYPKNKNSAFTLRSISMRSQPCISTCHNMENELASSLMSETRFKTCCNQAVIAHTSTSYT
eukprot:6193384-Pleurochrysis_carterae.AAC.1